jgi:acylaminoacyl-peptidase
MRAPSADGARFVESVLLVDAEGGVPTAVGEGSRPAFAPVGEALARIVRRRDSTELVVRDTPTGTDRVVAIVDGEITALRWSPDASMLAFSADIASRRVGDRNARLGLFVVAATGGAARELLAPGFRLGPAEPELAGLAQFDWLDATHLVISGRAADARVAAEAASLHIVDVATGSARYLAGTGGRWHTPRVSPNRDWIAFTGQAITPQGWMAAELIVLRPDGTGLKRLTVGLDRDAHDVAWSHDSRWLWFAVEDRGTRNLMRVEVRNARVQSATTGTHLLELAALAPRDGWGVAIRHAHNDPGSLLRFRLDRAHEFRFLAEQPPVEFGGEIEELDLRGADGTAIQGWLFRPPGLAAGTRAPLLLDLHGGPHAMAGAGYAPFALAHAASGWLVVRANPRGSTGFGYDLSNGLLLRWPGDDVTDLRAVVDALVSRGLVDTTRIAVVGSGAGAVTAIALRAADTRISRTVLRCAGSGWLPGGDAVDRPMWSEWTAARPYRMAPMRWWEHASPRPGEALSPVLGVEGRGDPLAPAAFTGTVLADLDRRGVRTAALTFGGPCHELGPAEQRRLFEAEQAFLDPAP